jgi:hypothetical protein
MHVYPVNAHGKVTKPRSPRPVGWSTATRRSDTALNNLIFGKHVRARAGGAARPWPAEPHAHGRRSRTPMAGGAARPLHVRFAPKAEIAVRQRGRAVAATQDRRDRPAMAWTRSAKSVSRSIRRRGTVGQDADSAVNSPSGAFRSGTLWQGARYGQETATESQAARRNAQPRHAHNTR